MKTLWLTLLLGLSYPATILSQQLHIHEKDQNKRHSLSLDEVRCITFSDDQVYITKTDASTTAFQISEVRNLSLRTEDTSDQLSPTPEQEVNVFLNPVQGTLEVESTTAINSIRVFDMTGKVLFEAKEQEPSARISFEALPTGIYHVQVITESGSVVKRVIKNNKP